MFFESNHSIKENEFRLSFGRVFSFPLHLHRSFEFYAQVEGSSEVTVGDRSYHLFAGDAVLIFPFQVHSYRPIDPGHFAMCIFSPDLVSDFHKKIAHKIPVDSLFSYTIDPSVERDNIFLMRSIVYGICGSFDKNRRYLETAGNLSENLLNSLLLYADKHFRTDCLLRDAASKVGYDYAYVSKFFKRKVGLSFRAYVNLLRTNECRRLLKETAKSMTEIAEECGFHSLRTFDREFTANTGMTPTAYRKLHAHS